MDQLSAPAASSEFLERGRAEDFVDALCTEALEHPASRHTYLERIASGDLPDPRAAIRDLCGHYAVYSDAFPSYLEAVIARLGDPRHRALVLENLGEEEGRDPANPEGIPHRVLFRRFCRAAGVELSPEQSEDQSQALEAARRWRDGFLELCGARQAGTGIGAIGIATEMIVSRIYRYLHRGVTAHTDMTESDMLFLTLHMECDDEHADQMKRIAVELAEDLGQRRDLRQGVHRSLDLRCAFWDAMLERAQAMAAPR